MARKPAHLQAVGKRTPRERIWAAIRSLGAGGARFSRAEIADRCVTHAPPKAAVKRIDDATLSTYVTCLAAAGYLQPTQLITRYAQAHYTLMLDVGIDAPRVTRSGGAIRQGNGTLALWRAMRIHKQFGYRELAAFAGTEELRVATATAKTYCSFLARAGYLQIVRASKPGTPARYRLAKYTGPKAPMIQRVKHLYDPNLGQVVWHPEANS